MPFPANVEMLPPEATLRMRRFSESAMYRFPAESTVTPVGEFNCALVGSEPSPENPGEPLPTTVLIFRLLASILRIRLSPFSAK